MKAKACLPPTGNHSFIWVTTLTLTLNGAFTGPYNTCQCGVQSISIWLSLPNTHRVGQGSDKQSSVLPVTLGKSWTQTTTVCTNRSAAWFCAQSWEVKNEVKFTFLPPWLHNSLIYLSTWHSINSQGEDMISQSGWIVLCRYMQITTTYKGW